MVQINKLSLDELKEFKFTYKDVNIVVHIKKNHFVSEVDGSLFRTGKWKNREVYGKCNRWETTLNGFVKDAKDFIDKSLNEKYNAEKFDQLTNVGFKVYEYEDEDGVFVVEWGKKIVIDNVTTLPTVEEAIGFLAKKS